MSYAEIILPLNLKGIFTYKLPSGGAIQPAAGMRVLVPFRGRKIYTGIISEIHENAPQNFVAKEVINILDEKPVIPHEQLLFWQKISEYYLCNIGEVYRFAVPASLKLESETYLKLKPGAAIDHEILDVNELYLMQALEVKQLVNLSEMEAFIPKKEIVKTVRALIDLQYIEIDEKIAERYRAKETAYVRLAASAKNASTAEILLSLKNAKKQQELFLIILQLEAEQPGVPIKKSALFQDHVFGAAQLSALVQKGIAEEYFLEEDRLKAYDGETEASEALSDLQQAAKDAVDEAFNNGKNVLLHGVTSSGKTHIYLKKIEETLAAEKNVLFLVPEISLAKQITARLEKKYGKNLGYYHQKLTDFERVEVWRKIRNGELKIIVGTRNALFLPFQNLGLIIVDEEHDGAYRPREVAPYFNAKDATQMLAKFYGSAVILGSATPSAETFYAAKIGKLAYVSLPERFGSVELPRYEIIDFKEAQDTKNIVGNFSNTLVGALQHTLDIKKQAMVLHNKRGYAAVAECENCGHVTYCPNCDVVMTYHKSSDEMKCHYCGSRAAKPTVCPKCHSLNLNVRGIGVEQIQEELRTIFPDAEIDRMDVDAMRKKFAYEKLYEKIKTGETDIIVGTQMISKGLDFDDVETVAVPRADSMLYVPDFRAEERAYQLITQVAGRAGRASGKGKVFLQTFNPQHTVFRLIAENNAADIYNYLFEERKKFNYPPFTRLIMLEINHRKEEKVERASRFLGSVLQKYLPAECIFGPEKAVPARINTLYRYQILLKLPRGKKYQTFKEGVVKSLEEFSEITAYASIKRYIFVDF